MLAEGKGFCLAEKIMKNENMLPVKTVLVRRQLGWESDVALGQVGRMFGQCLISSSSSAQMITCKFLNSSKSQSEILNYQILHSSRVL